MAKDNQKVKDSLTFSEALLAQNPNFLVLDEPTNDLDLQTLAILEEFLIDEFEGCLIVVSHDRRFMDRVTESLLIFQGEGEISQFTGSFTEYLEYLKLEREEKQNKSKSNSNSSSTTKTGKSSKGNENTKRKPSSKEKREFSGLEDEIERLKENIGELETKMYVDSGVGYSELADLQRRCDELKGTIEAKELRWLELAEICME